MKKILLNLIVAFCVLQANAQAPQQFNYQGVARNSSGLPIASQAIGLRISILDLTSTGTNLYTETHATSTNTFGLFNVAIGGGTVVSGAMATINWAAGAKFVKVEMDPAGGTAYVDLGTSQLLTVPYALRAEDAGRITIHGSGTQNADKMVIQHSPAYPTWGLQYDDTLDQFLFVKPGIAVLNVNLGGSKVIVNGSFQVVSGVPGVNKVLTSDATGNATWQDPSVVPTTISAFQPTGCQNLASVTTTLQKIANMGTFTKNTATTVIELNLQTNLYVASSAAAGIVFELRVDDVATTIGNATALLREVAVSIPASITGVFTGLTAGTHTVSLWARAAGGSGTATDAYWDAGCFNSAGVNNVLVKEFK